MTIWNLLTSRIGAISKGGALGLAATVGLVGVNFYGYLNDSPKAQEQQIATLSQIIARGGEVPAEYNSAIQVLGDGRLATAEERAAFEGSLVFDGGEEAVAGINSLSAGMPGGTGGVGGVSVSGTALGQGEAGLGMGGNEAKAVGGQGGASGQAVADPAAGVGKALGTKINKLGDTPEGGLQRASMARATGGNGSRSFAGDGTAASARGAAQAEGQGRIGASSISGAMPGGAMLVSAQDSLRGARSASYVSGNRSAHVGTGVNSREGNSLRSIAVQSSKVAANANRSANEGDQVFMGGERLAGSVTFEDGTVNMTEGSSVGDFEDKLDDQESNLNTAMDEVDTTQQERKNHRTRLTKLLIGLMAATFMGMMGIQACIDKGGFWGWLGALAIAGILLTAIGFYMGDAVEYNRKYENTHAGWHVLAGALLMTGVGVAFIKGANKWLGTASKFLFKNAGLSLATSVILGTPMSMGIDSTIESIKAQTGGKDDSLKNG